MNIINEKFNFGELNAIYQINPFMGDIEGLSFYNNTPYFNIQKFYKEGRLCGYAVVFLGYNELTSPEASLEDVAYWAGTPEDLEEFLNKVRKARNYSIEVESICYEPDKFAHLRWLGLDKLGFKAVGRQR